MGKFSIQKNGEKKKTERCNTMRRFTGDPTIRNRGMRRTFHDRKQIKGRE